MAIAIVAGFTLSRHHDRTAEAATPVTTTSTTATTAIVQAVRRRRSFTSPACPEGAKLSFDGAPLDGNPFSSSFTRDGLPHRVQADAPGYAPKSEVG